MHARAGFPKNKVHAALVLHGAASEAALSAEAYRDRHGAPNPNLQLLSELRAAGVQIFLCGQSAAHRGIAHDDLSADVDLALSAMTVLVQLQSSGYSLIAF
jgi:intracellular sulfur oxidation DsrE/DsrF family protein